MSPRYRETRSRALVLLAALAVAWAGCRGTKGVPAATAPVQAPEPKPDPLKSLRIAVYVSTGTDAALRGGEWVSYRPDFNPSRWINDVMSDLKGRFGEFSGVEGLARARAAKADLVAGLDCRASFVTSRQALSLGYTLSLETPEGASLDAISVELRRRVMFGDMISSADAARGDLLKALESSEPLAAYASARAAVKAEEATKAAAAAAETAAARAEAEAKAAAEAAARTAALAAQASTATPVSDPPVASSSGTTASEPSVASSSETTASDSSVAHSSATAASDSSAASPPAAGQEVSSSTSPASSPPPAEVERSTQTAAPGSSSEVQRSTETATSGGQTPQPTSP